MARHHLEQQREIFGSQLWEYGLTEGNIRPVNKLQEYAEYQGLDPRQYALDELFSKSTLDKETQSKGHLFGIHQHR